MKKSTQNNSKNSAHENTELLSKESAIQNIGLKFLGRDCTRTKLTTGEEYKNDKKCVFDINDIDVSKVASELIYMNTDNQEDKVNSFNTKYGFTLTTPWGQLGISGEKKNKEEEKTKSRKWISSCIRLASAQCTLEYNKLPKLGSVEGDALIVSGTVYTGFKFDIEFQTDESVKASSTESKGGLKASVSEVFNLELGGKGMAKKLLHMRQPAQSGYLLIVNFQVFHRCYPSL